MCHIKCLIILDLRLRRCPSTLGRKESLRAGNPQWSGRSHRTSSGRSARSSSRASHSRNPPCRKKARDGQGEVHQVGAL